MFESLSGTTKMFGGVALLGVIGAFWGHLKMVMSKLASIFIVAVELDDEGIEALISYLRKYGKFCKLGVRRFEVRPVYLKSLSRFTRVFCEMIGRDPAIYLFSRKEGGLRIWPVIIGKSIYGNNESENRPGTALILRGTFDIEKLINNASIYYNEMWKNLGMNVEGEVKEPNRFYIDHVFGSLAEFESGLGRNSEAPKESDSGRCFWYNTRNIKMGLWRVIGYDIDDVGMQNESNEREINYLSYPPEIKELIDKIIMWSKSKDWFKEKNLAWKMGISLFGIPGSGKSVFSKAIAELLNYPLFRYDLTTMKNADLNAKWHEMMHSTPCVALFEDIDTIFHGRQNIYHKQTIDAPLTFDCLLNTIDGIEKNNGILTIMTGNDISKIDSALGRPTEDKMEDNKIYNSTRPGRIDLVANFGKMEEACRREFAFRIMSDIFEDDYIENLVMECEGWSPSQFSKKCESLSLQKFWDNSNIIDIREEKHSAAEFLDELYEACLAKRNHHMSITTGQSCGDKILNTK